MNDLVLRKYQNLSEHLDLLEEKKYYTLIFKHSESFPKSYQNTTFYQELLQRKERLSALKNQEAPLKEQIFSTLNSSSFLETEGKWESEGSQFLAQRQQKDSTLFRIGSNQAWPVYRLEGQLQILQGDGSFHLRDKTISLDSFHLTPKEWYFFSIEACTYSVAFFLNEDYKIYKTSAATGDLRFHCGKNSKIAFKDLLLSFP